VHVLEGGVEALTSIVEELDAGKVEVEQCLATLEEAGSAEALRSSALAERAASAERRRAHFAAALEVHPIIMNPEP